MKIFLLTFLALFVSIYPQSKSPEEILNEIIKNFDRVKDYQVDINVKVDVEFLKVPDTNAKIYFKQPDKIHLESDGFALLPKEGLDFSPSALLKKNYTALYEKDVNLDGINTSVVKVIPIGDEGNVILSTLWIDQQKKVIRKIESTTKTNGTFTINFYYDDDFKYPLPSKIIFSFNFEQLNLPRALNNDTNSDQPQKKRKGFNSNTKGQVIVSYSNYKVNKGIQDSIFQEKDKSDKSNIIKK
jgi:outer membrane lipoprotein-sorting protein